MLPLPLGLTSTVSLKLGPGQAAPAGFVVNSTASVSGSSKAIRRDDKAILTILLFKVFNLPSESKYSA